MVERVEDDVEQVGLRSWKRKEKLERSEGARELCNEVNKDISKEGSRDDGVRRSGDVQEM